MPRDSTLYNLAGTKFLRLASHAIFSTYGGNMQNKSKQMRKIYWADEGKILNQADQSGAEALIVAYLCRPGNYRELFLQGVKVHCYVALRVFKEVWQAEIDKVSLDIKCNILQLLELSIAALRNNEWWPQVDGIIRSSDNWEPARRYYYISKQIAHSSNYGVGPAMFCLNTLDKSQGKVVISRDEAKKYLEEYHNPFPEIREWHKDVERQVRETRYLYNLLGNPIYFSGDLERPAWLKEAFSAIPQSTVGMITRVAFTKMQALIEEYKLDWDILQDNHDSYLVQCPESEQVDCRKAMKQFLEADLVSPRGEKFKMKSEIASGYNWSPYHKDKNPEGLKEVRDV